MHTCNSLLLQCIDFRLGRAVKQWAEEKKLLDDCDIVAVAGAVKNLTQSKTKFDQNFILGQIEISVSLHHISQVILMNHTDCGAYGSSRAFASDQVECDHHIAEMKQAKELIRQKFPQLNIKLILAVIAPLRKWLQNSLQSHFSGVNETGLKSV